MQTMCAGLLCACYVTFTSLKLWYDFVCRFIIFLGVYSGIVSNTNLSRFIRYNAMQAVLLDILLM
jgi:hypothetical protein